MDSEEAYRAWKQELAKSGKTPEEMVARYRAIGMKEYADKLDAVIQRMEGSAAALD